MKLFFPHDDVQLRKMFIKHNYQVSLSLHKSDVVVFSGGADVTPFLYGEKKHDRTHSNLARDLKEIQIFKDTPTKKPKIGICRGAQFLNVMCGGRLYQDVDGHLGDHKLIDYATGKDVLVTSTHHQMMIPSDDAKLLGFASNSKVKVSCCPPIYFNSIGDTSVDTEVLWYEYFNSLCFQPHPEYDVKECEDYFFDLFNTYIIPLIKKD